MTKTEFATQIVIKHCGSLEAFTESDIFQSGAVAVAAEFLGLLKSDDAILYASTRGGIYSVDTNTDGATVIVSVREYMSKLPD